MTDRVRLNGTVLSPDDLVDMAEVAEIAGVQRSTVKKWRERYGDSSPHPFPQPWKTFAMGPVFLRRKVERWLSEH